MAATLVLSVRTGSGSGTANDGVSGIDLISADNHLNDLSNRQQYPITVGTNSYEKWVSLKITATPANYVQNFSIWGPGTDASSTALYFTSQYVTYQQGTTATSTIATATFTQYTAGHKATWDTTQYTAGQLNAYTKYCVFQLQVGPTAGPGNWTQETINYSYDEA